MAEFSYETPLDYFRSTPNIGLNTDMLGAERDRLWRKSGDTFRFPAHVHFDIKAESNTVQTRRQGVQTRNMLRAFHRPNAPDTGGRYLPWLEDHCTYVRLDSKARFAVTGPLSGCNIYVGGAAEDLFLFHTNLNGDPGPAGDVKKRKWVLSVLGRVVKGPSLVGGSLEGQSYTSKNMLGFVFGHRNKRGWHFYFYGNNLDNVLMVRKFYPGIA